jgi:hypothetical protein
MSVQPVPQAAPVPAPVVKVGWPKIATLVLALIGGVLQILNYSVISATSSVHAIIAVIIYFLISAGIPPLTGDAFRAAIHMPAWVSYVVSGLLGSAVLAITTVHMDAAVHETLAAVITIVEALGFSAQIDPVPIRA